MHKILMLMKCLFCTSIKTKKNGKWKSVKAGQCQQYVCKECHRNWSVPLRADPPIMWRLKWRVAQAIALYAIGLTRAEIKKRIKVASGTVRRNLEWFADVEQEHWDELKSFILRYFQTVHKTEMDDLKIHIYARVDGLSLQERRWDNQQKAKARSKAETAELVRRINTILHTKDRR